MSAYDTTTFSGNLAVEGATAITGNLTVGSKKIANTFTVTAVLPGAAAATAANYGPFWIAPFACEVVEVTEIHTHVGGSGASVTIERLQGTEAPDGGDDLLDAAFDLTSTANTLQTGSVVTDGTQVLAAGNRLGIKDAGTLTAATDLVVTVTLKAV